VRTQKSAVFGMERTTGKVDPLDETRRFIEQPVV